MQEPSPISILAGAELEAYRRVRYNGTSWVYCAAYEDTEAVTCARIASGARGAAWPVNESGILPISCAGTTPTVGSELYGAASGQGTMTVGGGVYLGVVNRVNPQVDTPDVIFRPSRKVLPLTGSAAALVLTAAQSGGIFTNAAATGALAFKLPAAKMGLYFWFVVDAAQALTIQTVGGANGDKVCLPDTGVPGAADKGLVNAGTPNVCLGLICAKNGIWSFMGGNAKVGIWTAEA